MKIYCLLKRMITTGNYQKENMQNKLNVFFAVNQLSEQQYLELMELITPKQEAHEETHEDHHEEEKDI